MDYPDHATCVGSFEEDGEEENDGVSGLGVYSAPALFFCDRDVAREVYEHGVGFPPREAAMEEVWNTFGHYQSHVTAVPHAMVVRVDTEPLRVFDCARWMPVAPFYASYLVKRTVPSKLDAVQDRVHIDHALLLGYATGAVSYYHETVEEIAHALFHLLPPLLEAHPDLHILHVHPLVADKQRGISRHSVNSILRRWLHEYGFPLERVLWVDRSPSRIFSVDTLFVASPPRSKLPSPGTLLLARSALFRRFDGLYHTVKGTSALASIGSPLLHLLPPSIRWVLTSA